MSKPQHLAGIRGVPVGTLVSAIVTETGWKVVVSPTDENDRRLPSHGADFTISQHRDMEAFLRGALGSR
jgi:hypothetical protein